MSLLERIKATIFGEAPPPPPRTVEEDNDDAWADTVRARGSNANVSTPADDPVMDDIAAGGVQPVSKPEEIEQAQNPKRRPIDRLN